VLCEDLWLVFDLSSMFLSHLMGLEPAVQATIYIAYHVLHSAVHL
jgi:hypothetical protein